MWSDKVVCLPSPLPRRCTAILSPEANPSTVREVEAHLHLGAGVAVGNRVEVALHLHVVVQPDLAHAPLSYAGNWVTG